MVTTDDSLLIIKKVIVKGETYLKAYMNQLILISMKKGRLGTIPTHVMHVSVATTVDLS